MQSKGEEFRVIGILFYLLILYNMSKISHLTEEGMSKLRAELEHLKTVERPACSRAIAEARDKGDLSENAEYDAAKEAQGLLELRISKLEALLANARVIDESKINTEQVQILNKVKIRNVQTKKEMSYTLVSEPEANLRENKIAVNTPIAQALIGKQVGDVVDVKAPSGVIKFQILEISI